MIATMLQHAEGLYDERLAAVLPTLKVILLGGMQEPDMPADRPSPGCSSPVRPLALAADPAGLVQDAVEEGLRWVSPIGTQTRRVLVETELGGVTLPAGANLGALVSSANRDEEVWGPTADAYDLFRPTTQPRRLRVRLSLLLGPSLLAGPDADRGAAALRAASRTCGPTTTGRRRVFNGWEFRAPQHLHVRWDA